MLKVPASIFTGLIIRKAMQFSGEREGDRGMVGCWKASTGFPWQFSRGLAVSFVQG